MIKKVIDIVESTKFLLVYTEVNAIMILILIYLTYVLYKYFNVRFKAYLYNIVFSIIGVSSMGTLWKWIDYKVVNPSIDNRYVINSIFFIFMQLSFYYAYKFFNYQLNGQVYSDKQNKILTQAPLLSALYMIVFNYWTHDIFVITSNGLYIKGPLYWIQYLFGYGYLFLISFKAIAKYQHEKNKNHIIFRNYVGMMIYPIFPAILGYIEMNNPDLPLLSVGLTSSIFLFVIDMVKATIVDDSLTDFHSRNLLLSTLKHKMKSQKRAKEITLYLFVMDIKNFSSITNNYGPFEGERILVEVANCLKKTCGLYCKNNVYISRYSGDEFVCIIDLSVDEDPLYLYDRFYLDILQYAKNVKLPYPLELNIGYEKYKKEYDTDAQRFVMNAESQLIVNKRIKMRG